MKTRDRSGSTGETGRGIAGVVRENVAEFLSGEYESRIESAYWLASQGESAAEELIRALKRSGDMSALPALANMLGRMGDAAHGPMLRAIDQIELRRPKDVYLIECLLDVLPTHRPAITSPVVVRLIDRCKTVIAQNANAVLVSLCRRARERAHAILGEMGDRSRLNDLIAVTREGGPHLSAEIVDALEAIGDRRAIAPLLRSYEAKNSPALKDDIREAFLRVLKREGLTPESAEFPKLSREERVILHKVWRQRAANGNGNGHGNGHASGNGSNGAPSAKKS